MDSSSCCMPLLTHNTNLPSILSTIAARRHSIFRHPLCAWLHTCRPALKLAVNTRSGDTPHHDWNRPAGRPRTTWTSQIGEHRTHCCRYMGCCWGSANLEDATTHRWLHSIEWVSELFAQLCTKKHDPECRWCWWWWCCNMWLYRKRTRSWVSLHWKLAWQPKHWTQLKVFGVTRWWVLCMHFLASSFPTKQSPKPRFPPLCYLSCAGRALSG